MDKKDYERFQDLRFEDFKKMAQDERLSCYEKIGFPNAYRQGKEEYIFADIISKLKNLNLKNKVVIDIGPGCSELAFMLIELCRIQGHTLILIDSAEMLAHLPDEPFIRKVPHYYPQSCQPFIEEYTGKVDVILTYSVLHYVFVEANIFEFLDKSLGLLASNGEMLIGDVPNISKRKRFFSSLSGILYHQEFTGTKEIPVVKYNDIEHEKIDDAVILGLVQRCRNSGFDAYILPQAANLPMANRREDILIVKP
ncbi:MAG: SAM-dependent methyltransferase [Syntrophomonas sp.]